MRKLRYREVKWLVLHCYHEHLIYSPAVDCLLAQGAGRAQIIKIHIRSPFHTVLHPSQTGLTGLPMSQDCKVSTKDRM